MKHIVTLHGCVDPVTFEEMPHGSYGVIVEGDDLDRNELVKKIKRELVVGVSNMRYWHGLWPQYRVRILQPGEQFTVTVCDDT